MRRKVMSMRISAVIMSAVLSMSSVTVYADTTNRHILEGNNAIEVVLPESIDISRDGNKFAGSGEVLAMYNYGTGHNAYEDKVDSLMVIVDTSVEYINTEDSSKKVTGSVSFGESGVGRWSVDEIDNMAVKEIIVETPLPKSGGTYEGVINYTIVSDGSAGFSLRKEVDFSEYEEMTLDSDTILYADMDTDSEVLEKLEGKSKVYIISSEEEDNGIWYEVYTSDEVRGWIFLDNSGVEEVSDEESTETEENTEEEEEAETEESTEDEESCDETTETEEGSDESSETEESSDDETDSEENSETETTEDSSSAESTTSEDSESDEIVEGQESSGVETVSEEAEEVIIEEGGESIPYKGDSDIPKVKIEAEVKDEEQE